METDAHQSVTRKAEGWQKVDDAEVPGQNRGRSLRQQQGGGGRFEDSPGAVLSPTRRSSCGWHVLCRLRIPASTPTSS